jgi:hypothetical protein
VRSKRSGRSGEISICAEEPMARKRGRRTQLVSFVLYVSELTMPGSWMISAEDIDR